MYDRSGIRLRDIVAFANDRSNIQPQSRIANIRGLADHLGSVFKHRFRMRTEHPLHHKMMKWLNIRYYEAYLTFLYLLIKFLFFTNVAVQVSSITICIPLMTYFQMFMMNKFLQTDDYDFYGFGVLKDILRGKRESDFI